MIISQNHHTPTSTNHTPRRPQTPQPEPMEVENSHGHAVVAHPRQQHRRSRSLSEVWLEHRPQGTVQTGTKTSPILSQEIIFSIHLETLLQPKFAKKVCTQKAPAKNEIARTTKYVFNSSKSGCSRRNCH